MTARLTRRSALTLLAGSVVALSRTARAAGNADVDVLIIGAGISGLSTAMLLEEQGVKVRILEAGSRVGGRVLTLSTEHGPVDVGASQVGSMYARVRDLIGRFKLETYTPVGLPPREVTFNVGGELVPISQWKDSSVNKTVGFERALPPPFLGSAYVGRNNPLTTLDAWTMPEHAALDISFAQFLRSKGVSEEAFRLIGVGNHAASLEDISALNEMRKALVLKQETGPAVVFVRGGTTKITDAMRSVVKADVVLQQKVTAIQSARDHVTAVTADGKKHRARFAVVTLPFSVLRDVRFEPGLAASQASAIRELNYSEATYAIFSVDGPYWESDSLPAAMWTDGLLEQLFTLPGADGKPQQLLAFLNGASDRRLRQTPSAERAKLLESELAKLRPSTQGKVRLTHTHSWADDPNARGAYAFFGPGQIKAFASAMAKPSGRVHFAGEHTALLHSGLEGAMESAERVALEVLERV